MVGQVTFGEYIRRLRRAKRWTLDDVAQRAGLSGTHLSRIENDSAVPSPETVVRLAEALDGDLTQLLDLAKCLPQEILDRLIDRASASPSALRRSATDEGDPGFARALVEEIDPTFRRALAHQFSLPDDDVDGIFAVLQRLADMAPDARRHVIAFLTTATFDPDGSREEGRWRD
jgi:transcriptional regulator with XRE-family HTH domain